MNDLIFNHEFIIINLSYITKIYKIAIFGNFYIFLKFLINLSKNYDLN